MHTCIHIYAYVYIYIIICIHIHKYIFMCIHIYIEHSDTSDESPVYQFVYRVSDACIIPRHVMAYIYIYIYTN